MDHATFIQAAVAQAIKDNPEAAAQEVPEILGHYIIDNTALNRVYRAAKVVVDSPIPSKLAMAALRWAVSDAEKGNHDKS